MTQQLNDFVVDTRGHCFFCLTQIPSPSPKLDSGKVEQQSSLHSLSRYLRMDMSKVFHEKESIPSELLEIVKRSRLKVALCENCSQWNDRISALCRQLEKIETEVTSYLELVHEGLSRSNGDDKTDLFCDNDSHSNLGVKEKGRIVKALRTEAMQRCSRKMKSSNPRVKVQRLIANQAVLRQQSVKLNRPPGNEDSMTDSISMDVDQVKIENYHHDDDDDDADGSERDHFEEGGVEYGGTEINSGDDPLISVSGVEGDACLVQRPGQLNQSHSFRNEPTALNRGKRKRTFGTAGESSTETVEELTSAVNPVTGKFKCNPCGKEFSRRSSLMRHHRSAHIGVRFKCELCGKCFTQLKSLTQHQQSVHLGQRFQCNLCSRSFTLKFMMAAHMRKEHPQ